jgi:fluoride exporter
MMMLKNFLLVGLGSSIGGMLRYLISLIFKSKDFPYQTIFVNVVGSFVIGIVFAVAAKQTQSSEQIKLFFATGICGGFTTFSAFSIENMQLIKSGNYFVSLTYIVATIIICLVATFEGYKLFNQ